VNWIRAAAIVARIDPVGAGYLVQVGGTYRLPPLRDLDAGIDLATAGQLNLLPEYAIHNLSDADFTFTIPAVNISDVVLPKVAPAYGYDPKNVTSYNWKFRNTVLAHLAGENILFAYESGGTGAVQHLIDALRVRGIL